MKDFEASKSYYKKAISLSGDDSESYDSIGVIGWTESYQPRMEVRARLGLKPEQSTIYATDWQIRDRNQEIVAEGINMLTEALRLHPDYDDAMSYMNLMYRERADIRCGDASQIAPISTPPVIGWT